MVWHVPYQDTFCFTPNPETVQSFPFERECPELCSAFCSNFSIKDGFCVTLHNKEGTKLVDNLYKKYLLEYFPYINPERITALYVPQKGALTFQTRFNMVSETNIPMDQATVYKGYLYTEKPEESQPVVVKIETGDNKEKVLYDLTAD